MVRWTLLVGTAVLVLAGAAAPALACGGLVNPNGTVSLVRTTTLAGYVGGVEHYVTNFEFAGGGAEFGSIVPLPGVPSDVKRAGDWTLQRLVEEITPPQPVEFTALSGAAVAEDQAQVLLETQIDALDITILKGGGDEVGRWAEKNGFTLTPDAPEILDFYASRSPVFMAVRFDPKEAAARGQQIGDGTPIQLTIPTPNPWVPLRILTLGLPDDADVRADVFLLTQNVPELLPAPIEGGDRGMVLKRSEEASPSLLRDLGSDKGMEWLPTKDMWLTYLSIDSAAEDLRFDLAIDATGVGEPSPVAAGLTLPVSGELPDGRYPGWAWVAAAIALWGALALRNSRSAA